MAKLREEKFDFALAHHIDLCPVSVIQALEVPLFTGSFAWSIVSNRFPDSGLRFHPVHSPEPNVGEHRGCSDALVNLSDANDGRW